MPPKREPQLQFRVTEQEARQFRDWADSVDMSFSAFARRALMLGAVQLVAYPQLRSVEFEYLSEQEENQ